MASSEAPRARHEDQLHSLAASADIPLTLPRPLFALPDQRAVPQNASDKAGAEGYLMALRPKKFILGKSSKSFSSDEIMLALDKAVKDGTSTGVVEALLQLAESSGADVNKANTAFSASKKGQAVPTMDYIFSQTESPGKIEVWRLFLGRVSQRARDNSLAGALKQQPVNLDKITSLVEWGANPDLCHDRIMELLADPDTDQIIETVLLSPLLTSPEFLNRALVKSASLGSVRKSSMILFREGDANFNRGEALRTAISAKDYHVVLSLLVLSKRAISASIIDEAVGLISALPTQPRKELLKILLLAGSTGLRTSRVLLPYIQQRDHEILPLLIDTHACSHGSFPTAELFQAAVLEYDVPLALTTLKQGRIKALSDFAITGVHLQLVETYFDHPQDILNLLKEFLSLSLSGDFTSQMLAKACEMAPAKSVDVLPLVNILIQRGDAKSGWSEGKCLLNAVEAKNVPLLKTLLSTQPSKKVLNRAFAQASQVLRDEDSSKAEIWSALIEAGSSGLVVDEQLSLAIDDPSFALAKVKVLISAASLDYSDGEAVIKAINIKRLDLLELCLSVQRPQTSLPWIWKQTREMFAINTKASYRLDYMQKVFQTLYQINKGMAPSDELLLEASQCPSREIASALVQQFLHWGASPDHDLGASLVACVKQNDTATLTSLLAETPNKTSLRYAFEAALLPNVKQRHNLLRLIVGAGVEKTSLDVALPKVLKEKVYDAPVVHLLVDNGAVLDRSIAENLTSPARALDIPVVENLIAKSTGDDSLLVPLQAVFNAHPDWQSPEGKSVPMLKLLLSKMPPGTWADSQFVASVKALNQHAADLFITHLTSDQVPSTALHGLLTTDKSRLSLEKLSLTNYLLRSGASGDIVDEVYLQAVGALRLDWITVLDPHLTNSTTRSSAFEILSTKNGCKPGAHVHRLEITEFLLGQGLRGTAIDSAFIQAARTLNIQEMRRYLPSISSQNTFSEALDSVTSSKGFLISEDSEAAIRFLIENGASGAPVLKCARMAAEACKQSTVQLIFALCDSKEVTKAALIGLMGNDDPLTTPESRVILQELLCREMDGADIEKIAGLAASRYNIALLRDIESYEDIDEIHDVALETLVASKGAWLCTAGITFLEYLLGNRASTTLMPHLIEDAAKAKHLPALRLILGKSPNKHEAATAGFAALKKKDLSASPLSKDTASVVKLLLQEGARGPAVENLAGQAAAGSDHETLEILLNSPAARFIIPVAFRAVARRKTGRLTSDQLSVGAVLVKRGVSTELISIAATETAKLMDLEALKALSESPHFRHVTDDALRALLVSEDSDWRTPEGVRVIKFLLDIGVSIQSMEAIASKAATVLDVDVLRVVLNKSKEPQITQAAFESMTGAGSRWLCAEGLRTAKMLLNRRPSQSSIDRAFIQACAGLENDIVNLFYPHITDIFVFNESLAQATASGTAWLSHLDLITRLLDSGVDGDTADAVLVKGASHLHHDCVELLSSRIHRPDVYTDAFAQATMHKDWRQSLPLIQILLDGGAYGNAVEQAYIDAARHLDYQAAKLVAYHVDNTSADDEAFTAATTATSWLSPGSASLIEFLFSGRLSSDAIKPALENAAKAFNVNTVTLLSKAADERLASSAFATVVFNSDEWDLPAGTSVLTILAEKGARGPAVEQALVRSAGLMRIDLVRTLLPNIARANTLCLSKACDELIESNQSSWFMDEAGLQILEVLIERGAHPSIAAQALVAAASYGAFPAVTILTSIVEDATVYAEAFDFITEGDLLLDAGNQDMIDHLLSHTGSYETLHMALIKAIEQFLLGDASADLVLLLLRHGADINYGNGQALKLAVEKANLELIETLVQQSPATALTLYLGLQEAFFQEFEETTVKSIFDLLATPGSLEASPDVNHDSELGSPLIFYCLQNYPTSAMLAKTICDLGADMTAQVSCQVYTDEQTYPGSEIDMVSPLIWGLCKNAADEVIKDVIIPYSRSDTSTNVDSSFLNQTTENTRTNAVVLAAKLDRHDLLSAFLDLGARADQKDCFDRSALFYAARNGNTKALTSLLKKKLLINDGSLHEAARELHPQAVQMLIKAGHEVNFPSLKHAGRTPLCELCHGCRGSEHLVELDETLSKLKIAKVKPLQKCREFTPLFYAIENPDPVPVVTKLIEVMLWQDHSDSSNVYSKGDYFYSPTMYIKKGLCGQPERVQLEVLEVLVDMNVEDRYYAKERMTQPHDAVGLPQHIADMDHKKWIRSSRLEEQDEDHRRKMRYEEEAMSKQDQLHSKRHLLSMQRNEDLARQTIDHSNDTHWLGMAHRHREHNQGLRFRDNDITYKLDDMAVSNHVQGAVTRTVRDAQISYNTRTGEQRLGFLDREQALRLGGAQDQQLLRLEGVSHENRLKSEQTERELGFRERRFEQDHDDMNYKLQHLQDMNMEKYTSQSRAEELAREAHRERNFRDQQNRQNQLDMQQSRHYLEQTNRQNLLDHQQSSDLQRFRTQSDMNQLEQDGLRQKYSMAETERQDKLRYNDDSNRQMLDTTRHRGEIENSNLRDRGVIQQDQLRRDGEIRVSNSRSLNAALVQNARDLTEVKVDGIQRVGQAEHSVMRERNEISESHLKREGSIRVDNSRNLGRQNVENTANLGKQQVTNSANMGAQQVTNTKNMGEQQVKNSANLGNQQTTNARNLGAQQTTNARNLGSQQAMNARNLNNLNAQKNANNVAAARNVAAAKHGYY